MREMKYAETRKLMLSIKNTWRTPSHSVARPPRAAPMAMSDAPVVVDRALAVRSSRSLVMLGIEARRAGVKTVPITTWRAKRP